MKWVNLLLGAKPARQPTKLYKRPMRIFVIASETPSDKNAKTQENGISKKSQNCDKDQQTSLDYCNNDLAGYMQDMT